MKRKTRFTLNLIKLIFSLFLIYWIVKEKMVDFNTIGQLSSSGYIFILIILVFTQIVFNSLRWYYLVNGQGLNIPFLKSLSLTFISVFFCLVTPGGAGGDFFKGYYLLKHFPKQKLLAGMGLVLDRYFGMIGVSFLCSISFLLRYSYLYDEKRNLFYMGLFSVVILTALISILLLAVFGNIERFSLVQWAWNKIWGGKFIKNVYFAFKSYAKKPIVLLQAFLTCIISLCMVTGCFIVVGMQMKLNIDLSTFFFIIPIGLLVSMVPLTPGGIGVGQVAFMTLFNDYLGFNTTIGATGFSVYQLFLFFWSIVGVFCYLAQGKNIRKEITSTQLDPVEA